jgi:hypothetical protein
MLVGCITRCSRPRGAPLMNESVRLRFSRMRGAPLMNESVRLQFSRSRAGAGRSHACQAFRRHGKGAPLPGRHGSAGRARSRMPCPLPRWRVTLVPAVRLSLSAAPAWSQPEWPWWPSLAAARPRPARRSSPASRTAWARRRARSRLARARAAQRPVRGHARRPSYSYEVTCTGADGVTLLTDEADLDVLSGNSVLNGIPVEIHPAPPA